MPPCGSLLQWCLDRGYEPALHRADAARRPARLGQLEHGDGRRGARAHRGAFPSTRAPPRTGQRPRGAVPRRRRPGDGRHHRRVSAPFCRACDRVRLTADGQVRNRLFSRTETDLRGPAARRCVGCRPGCPPAGRDVAQGQGSRHRPAGLRPARPAHVRDRRLTSRFGSSRCSAQQYPEPARNQWSAGCLGDLRRRNGLGEEAPHREELAEAGAVLLAGQPDLATLWGVQPWVVPQVGLWRAGVQPLALTRPGPSALDLAGVPWAARLRTCRPAEAAPRWRGPRRWGAPPRERRRIPTRTRARGAPRHGGASRKHTVRMPIGTRQLDAGGLLVAQRLRRS